MASAPDLKVYTADNEYISSCKYAEDAMNMAQFRGVGATVRHGHAKKHTVYTVPPYDPDADPHCWDIDAKAFWTKVEAMFPTLYGG